MLGIPASMLNGGGNEEDDKKFIKYCVTNLLDEFTTAINKVLLLESEKDQYYFAADLYELTKGDIEKDTMLINRHLILVGCRQMRSENAKIWSR